MYYSPFSTFQQAQLQEHHHQPKEQKPQMVVIVSFLIEVQPILNLVIIR